MMIGFPQVMSSFAMRLWKVRDPKASDHIVGAFNLVRRFAVRFPRPTRWRDHLAWNKIFAGGVAEEALKLSYK